MRKYQYFFSFAVNGGFGEASVFLNKKINDYEDIKTAKGIIIDHYRNEENKKLESIVVMSFHFLKEVKL